MYLSFRAWLEATELDDPIVAAILGVTAPDQSLSDEEKEHELARNTNELSSDIQDEIKNLGVVKQSPNYREVEAAIDSEAGITIKELVEKVKGPNYAPNAGVQNTPPIVDPNAFQQPDQQMQQQP